MKQLLPWTTAKLVPEALKHRLHVVEDPALISLLGRKKFVDMVVFGAVGWQPGVSVFLARTSCDNLFRINFMASLPFPCPSVIPFMIA